MPKCYSSHQITKVLLRAGFVLVSQKGSHQKFRNAWGATVILPANKKIIRIGTFKSIVKQAGLDEASFDDLLKNR